MNQRGLTDILVRVDTVDQLFNAPAIDPLSDKPAVLLAEPALAHAVRQELGRGLRDWRGRCLVIQLPADQITPSLAPQLVAGVRRYAAAKIAENKNIMRISRWRSFVGLIIAIGIVLALVLIATALNATLLAGASDGAKAALAGLLTIFIWATVWNPWDRLIYEWNEPFLENRILRSVDSMEIVVDAEPPAAAD